MRKTFLTTISLVAIISLMSFTQKSTEDPSGRAYAITWQNDAGYWFAVGPVQALQSGEKTEEKAIDMVRGYQSKKKGYVKFLNYCGNKYTIYDLGVDYNSYDLDAIKYVEKRGFSCAWKYQ